MIFCSSKRGVATRLPPKHDDGDNCPSGDDERGYCDKGSRIGDRVGEGSGGTSEQGGHVGMGYGGGRWKEL